MAPDYTVGQLLEWDEPALVRYVVDHQDARGTLDITSIRDWNWDQVHDSQQIKLLERLKSAASLSKAPRLDLDHLFAKLDVVRAEREAASVASSEKAASSSQKPLSPTHLARSPTLSPEPDIAKKHQTRCYYELVNDGGRPPCSLETLPDIYKNPAAYVEVFRPWLTDLSYPLDPDDWGLFSRPLDRWKEFRRWQRDNRNTGRGTPDDETLSAYREERRRYFESTGSYNIPADAQFDRSMEDMWQQGRGHRRWKREMFREVRGGSFDEYVEAARLRLADHGFTEAFLSLEDVKRQSERMTWIEYIEFEYWWLDRYGRSVRRYQQQHDTAWTEVVESGILGEGETEEDFLESTAPRLEQFFEALQAEREGRDRRGIPHDQLRDQIATRFRKQTSAYSTARLEESRQLLRVQWALDQFRKDEPTTSQYTPSRKPNKRNRQDSDNGAPDESSNKKRKQSKENPARRGPRSQGTRMTSGLECPVATTRIHNKDGCRRSARINRLGTITNIATSLIS